MGKRDEEKRHIYDVNTTAHRKMTYEKKERGGKIGTHLRKGIFLYEILTYNELHTYDSMTRKISKRISQNAKMLFSNTNAALYFSRYLGETSFVKNLRHADVLNITPSVSEGEKKKHVI